MGVAINRKNLAPISAAGEGHWLAAFFFTGPWESIFLKVSVKDYLRDGAVDRSVSGGRRKGDNILKQNSHRYCWTMPSLSKSEILSRNWLKEVAVAGAPLSIFPWKWTRYVETWQPYYSHEVTVKSEGATLRRMEHKEGKRWLLNDISGPLFQLWAGNHQTSRLYSLSTVHEFSMTCSSKCIHPTFKIMEMAWVSLQRFRSGSACHKDVDDLPKSSGLWQLSSGLAW